MLLLFQSPHLKNVRNNSLVSLIVLLYDFKEALSAVPGI